jgi:hypothetical protein
MLLALKGLPVLAQGKAEGRRPGKKEQGFGVLCLAYLPKAAVVHQGGLSGHGLTQVALSGPFASLPHASFCLVAVMDTFSFYVLASNFFLCYPIC